MLVTTAAVSSQHQLRAAPGLHLEPRAVVTSAVKYAEADRRRGQEGEAGRGCESEVRGVWLEGGGAQTLTRNSCLD